MNLADCRALHSHARFAGYSGRNMMLYRKNLNFDTWDIKIEILHGLGERI